MAERVVVDWTENATDGRTDLHDGLPQRLQRLLRPPLRRAQRRHHLQRLRTPRVALRGSPQQRVALVRDLAHVVGRRHELLRERAARAAHAFRRVLVAVRGLEFDDVEALRVV